MFVKGGRCFNKIRGSIYIADDGANVIVYLKNISVEGWSKLNFSNCQDQTVKDCVGESEI